ncbi:outer membrane protein TolC [Flavobacterium sp. 103]|uniref:TolC family protein n=1 Tax=unclassified Flavobacterium TaxID=196869 RepID=UPI000D5C532E|nr:MULTISPECIES: TolC family protein [unclassified Flavobacterium]PVX44680.1 outer membrane protein TolC [Flavobacterium sp. 103]QKJ63169.1 TolC family protein [Flavobacterium sp. M31R6]
MDYLFLKSLKSEFVILIIACFFSEIGFSQNDESVRIIRLDEAIELGIRNNNQLKIANSDVTIANENLNQSQIAKAPVLGLNMGYNYIGNPKVFEGFYEKNTTVDYFNHQGSANVFASMPLYYGGAINNQIDKQQLMVSMQESVAKMTETEIKQAITTQFFTLEKLYKEIEITKQNIVNTDIRIRQLESRVSNGQNLKSDLLRTELQKSNFEVAVFRSSNSIELISNYLDILTGLPTNTRLKPVLDGILIPAKEVSLQESLSEAYENRYEIKRSQINVKIAESSLDITKSGFKPYINANLLFNTQYPAQWPNYSDNILNYWAAGVSLSWEISSFYNIKHRANADKLQIDKSNIALAATKDQINQDVKAAYIRFTESARNITTFKKDVDLALSNYKIVKSRYDNDFAVISDIVDAELQLNEAKISLNNANIDAIIQYYSLQYAMGKL